MKRLKPKKNGDTGSNPKTRAYQILKAIVEHCNENPDGITLAQDWGGNSLTVLIDGSHTHVGNPDDHFNDLVNDLYRLFCQDTGLSLAAPVNTTIPMNGNDSKIKGAEHGNDISANHAAANSVCG